jgi:hypothetical protein
LQDLMLYKEHWFKLFIGLVQLFSLLYQEFGKSLRKNLKKQLSESQHFC